MTQSQIAGFAESVIKSQQRLLKNNPVALSQGEIEEIYNECF